MPSARGARRAGPSSVAPDHIPMPIDEAVLDFHALGEVETAAGPRTRVVVVAVRRETVERLHAACDAAGLQVEGVDLAAFGMLRALPRPTGRDALRRRRRPGERRRRQRVGLPLHASGRRRPRGDRLLRLPTARGSRSSTRSSGSGTSACSPTSTTSMGRRTSSTATREALEEGVRELADTVRNSLNFYRTQESAEPVERGHRHGSRAGDSRLRRGPLRAAEAAARGGRRRGRGRGRSTPLG